MADSKATPAAQPAATPPAQAPAEQPAATVAPQQYAAGTGWEVGQTAPADQFRSTDDHGAVYGPVTDTHPGGRARLIVAKGATVTAGVRAELDAAKADDETPKD